MDSVFAKWKGPTLNLAFYENYGEGDIVYRNATIILLIWLQRIDMIRSAHDVYHRTEVFCNDTMV